MAITRQNIIDLAPELATMPETQVSTVITIVAAELDNGAAYGEQANTAMTLLACHRLTRLKLQRNGATGPVVSESKTSLDAQGRPTTMSVGYASPRAAKDKDDWKTTVYGQWLLDMTEGEDEQLAVMIV